MKKVVLVLAILVMATPAWATVYITCTADGNEVTVDYNVVSEPNRARGFALDIMIDNDVNIIATSGYFVGDCNYPDADHRGYGIFPGSFGRLDETDGNFPVWEDPIYSPVAWKADAPDDTLDGLDSNGITVEMGSLFHPVTHASPNAPSNLGTLLKFRVEVDAGYSVTIRENAKRGGVVLENSSRPSVVCTPCQAAAAECFPSDHDDYDNWVEVGSPPCWCYPRQCHGDASGTSHDPGLADAKQKWVGDNDWPYLVAGWQIKREDLEAESKDGYDNLFMYAICADFSHSSHDPGLAAGKQKWVGDNDWPILVANWQKKHEECCDPGGDGDCCPDCLD